MPKSMTGSNAQTHGGKPTGGTAVGMTGMKPCDPLERSSVEKGDTDGGGTSRKKKGMRGGY